MIAIIVHDDDYFVIKINLVCSHSNTRKLQSVNAEGRACLMKTILFFYSNTDYNEEKKQRVSFQTGFFSHLLQPYSI